MINKRDFLRIQKDLTLFDEARERQISIARKVIQLSKLVIYSLQRDDVTAAKKHVSEMQKHVKKLSKDSLNEGITRVAHQEFVEAMTYFSFITKGIILSQNSLKVSTEDYLAGLCDLTGELGRGAVQCILKGNSKGAVKIRDLVDELYGEFLKFNLPNGDLRKKADAIKWNLKKLDEIVLEIKLKDGH